MNLPLAIFLAVLMLSRSSATAACFSTFYTKPTAYDVCKEKPCFLILPEAPYVFPTRQVEEEPVLPFECNEVQRRKSHPGLRGLFFDTTDGIGSIQATKSKSGNITEFMCIYENSPNCTFDKTIQFIQEAANSNNTGHQFIAGGYFIFLPARRSAHTIQSAPWVSKDTILLYSRDLDLTSFRQAQENILLPFDSGAWLVVACFISAIIIFYIFYIIKFMPNWDLMPAIYWIFIGDRNTYHRDDDALELAAWKTLKTTTKVFFTLLILLYEIAVAFFIFRGEPPLISDIKQLQSLPLEQLGVWKEAADESILANYVDREGQYIGPNASKNPPWFRYNNQSEMIDVLLKNAKVKYILTFSDDVRYFLYHERLCEKVVTASLRKREMGGWYYSSAVPKEVTDSFDKALLKLHLDRSSDLGDSIYGARSLDCGDPEQNVGGKVMVLLLTYAIVPLLVIYILFLFGAIFIKYLRRHQRRRAAHNAVHDSLPLHEYIVP